MREIRLHWPELLLIGATRGMLGIGIGLLLSDKLRARRRMEVGRMLAGIGAVSTIPLAIRVLRRQRAADGHTRPEWQERGMSH